MIGNVSKRENEDLCKKKKKKQSMNIEQKNNDNIILFSFKFSHLIF